MKVLYVGDAGDVVKRICTNHCTGNVEASALRRHLARAMGFGLTRTGRRSGSTRLRIDLPDPNVGESSISAFIRAGRWRFVVFESYAEANEFQWLVIDELKPELNVDRRPISRNSVQRFKAHLKQLVASPFLALEEVRRQPSGPGVYMFYHLRFATFRHQLTAGRKQ